MDAPRPRPSRRKTGPQGGPVDWRAVGLRKTPQREVVLELVRSCFDHPTAEWIHRHARQRIPEISLATVYRTLRLLKEKGLIHEFSGGASPSRWDGTDHDHEHVRCIRCGAVQDVELPEVGDIRERVAERSGYRVGDFPLVFHGVCEDCADQRGGVGRRIRGANGTGLSASEPGADRGENGARPPREDRRSSEDYW